MATKKTMEKIVTVGADEQQPNGQDGKKRELREPDHGLTEDDQGRVVDATGEGICRFLTRALLHLEQGS